MTSLLIFIKHHCAFVWSVVEWFNALVFSFLWPDIQHEAVRILHKYTSANFRYSLVRASDIEELSGFLNRQPSDYVAHFNPHSFDRKTLSRLLRNKAFLMMKITGFPDERIVGYFFLRCFFVGKAFHGLIVDRDAAGHGLGTTMWALSMQICHTVGLRMFATISGQNKASLHSVMKATDANVVEELADGYLLIECKSLF